MNYKYIIVGALMVVVALALFTFPCSATISFTFDDDHKEVITQAAPIMQKYGVKGTAYIITDGVGTKGKMNWSDLKLLQDVYGWEIGSHTKTHPMLPGLTLSKLTTELKSSKTTLTDNGLDVYNFASPYGHVNWREYGEIAKYYYSERSGSGENVNPINYYSVCGYGVSSDIKAKYIKQAIDDAERKNQWIVFIFHDLVKADRPWGDSYNISQFESIVKYTKDKGYRVVRVMDVVNKPYINIVPNPSFETTSESWATDWSGNSAYVTIDSNINGCMPSPEKSLKILASKKTSNDIHTNTLTISDKKYEFRAYLNRQGYIGYNGAYILELDKTGMWLKTTLLFYKSSDYVGYVTCNWIPDENCKYAGLYFYTDPVPAPSTKPIYIDNVVLTPTT